MDRERLRHDGAPVDRRSRHGPPATAGVGLSVRGATYRGGASGRYIGRRPVTARWRQVGRRRASGVDVVGPLGGSGADRWCFTEWEELDTGAVTGLGTSRSSREPRQRGAAGEARHQRDRWRREKVGEDIR